MYVKNYWLGGGLTYLLGMGAVSVGLEGAGMAIMFGGFGYLYYDYNVKKLEGASLKDAKIIAEKYNNDLIQRIFNEND